KYRILVIDDCQTVYHSIVATLGLNTYEIDRLELFVQLPSLLRKNPPDLILLDLNIPGLNGIKLGQLIRKFQSSSIPIIVYSSCSEEARPAAPNAVGAVVQLSKSATPETLVFTVYDALRKVEE
ncbi:MAG: response regulator, partial [Planctomycetota bacterium]|nr:response regulator [Planctomycetota bacterium]